ncbi:hypothetical protein Q7P37_006536 [Cladosporium fusiforme]
MRLLRGPAMGLRMLQLLIVFLVLQTLLLATASSHQLLPQQALDILIDQSLGPHLITRAESSGNSSGIVIDDKPSDSDEKLDYDHALSKGNNLLKLLATEDLSTCGVQESNFTEWEDLGKNGWSKYYVGAPKDERNWKAAAELLKLDAGDEQNVQYSLLHLINVTIDGKDYRASTATYNNVMNKDGAIFVLQSASPRDRGQYEKPPVDDSPGNELVPLQSWADVAFIEWADYCKGDEKCIKGLHTVVKCHAKNNATERVATEALGGMDEWGPWPGKTFSNGSKELAATLATPSGRGVAWLLLTHREQLGWKYVDTVDVWSEKEGEFKNNFFAFHIKDFTASQPPKARLARSPLDTTSQRGSALQSTNKGLIPRALSWDDAVAKGDILHDMLYCGSGPASEFTSYDSLADWGWRNGEGKADMVDYMNQLKDVEAQVNMGKTQQMLNQHQFETEHDGKKYPSTTGSYQNIYTPELIIAINNWSPRLSDTDTFPKLERMSDVLFLEYQRLMEGWQRPLTELRGLARYGIVNRDTKLLAAQALGYDPGERVTNWPRWPGRDFDPSTDEYCALIASPNGRAAVWLLANHKEQLGHKIIEKVRVYGEGSDLHMTFTFVDRPPSGESDEDLSGQEGLASRRKARDIAARGDGDRPSLHVPRLDEPDQFIPDEDWQPWVDKGKAYLELLNCGKGTESKWTSYDDLKKYGWARRGESHPVKIREKSGIANVMKYLEVSSEEDEQWSISDQHQKETTVDGKTYHPTNARYSNKYNMELITSDFNFGPRNKGPHAIMPVTGDPNPFPPLEHYSDVVYLEFERLMTESEKPINKLKGVLRSNIVNFETRELVERAVGVLKFDMTQGKLPWPGKDLDADSDELAALVASPNGRGVAWLLATHKKLGRKTISGARVFYDHGIYVLFVFQDLDEDSGEEDSSADTAPPRRDLIKYSAGHVLGRRALSQERYDGILAKGKMLVEALESKEDCFEQSEFTKYDALKEWGWSRKRDTKGGPSQTVIYTTVFDLVGASWEEAQNRWVLDSHDKKTEHDGKKFHSTQAGYGNYYNPAIIISSTNFGPAEMGPRSIPRVTGNPNPYPRLARLSDVLFLEYQRIMEEISDDYPMDQLKAVWRFDIVNEYTKSICIKFAAREEGYAAHHIPRWPGKDFAVGSDEFAALVGSPNGVAVAYLLLQHREQMGRKHITSARVWYDYALHMLFFIDDLQEEPSEPSSRPRRDSAYAGGLLDLFDDKNTTRLGPRALDQADFDSLVERGKTLVASLQSSDECMAQSEWTEYDSLATWGWYRMRKPKVGPVPQFTATKLVYEYVGASTEQDSNHRAYDSHSDKKEIDGVTYYQTGAEFDNRYNPAMIIAENIYGVEHEGKDRNPPVTGDPNPFPKLRFWSDVTFLEYQKFMQDTDESLDQLKAVWHRMIINPKTRDLAARLFDVAEWTDVPDWPGKDFSPGSDDFNAIIGSDNGKGVVFLLLQHREQLGTKSIAKARVWKDHTLHILYTFDDDTCSDGDDPSSTHDNRLIRRIDGTDSEILAKARENGRFLEMAQISTVDIMESCLDIEQNKFSELEDLGKSGWTLLQNTKEEVEEEKDVATFNSWLDLNLDLSADSNHKIEYQHLKKTTGSDGRVYYPSGAYYRSLFSEGAIAALDSRSPWSTGRDRNPRVDGKVNAFPPLKQWSDETFLVYKDICKGDPKKMANLKGVLRHSITNTDTKRALHEYMGKANELQDGRPKEWPGTMFKLDDDGFRVALGVPNGKGVAYLLATNREALGWKEIYQIRIFSASWSSSWNALYYIREHEDNPQRRRHISSPITGSLSGAIALHNSTGPDFDQASKNKRAANDVSKLAISSEVAVEGQNSHQPRADDDLYQQFVQKGSLLLCYAHNIKLDHDGDRYHQSTYTNFEDLATYGWSEDQSAVVDEIGLDSRELGDAFRDLEIPADEEEDKDGDEDMDDFEDDTNGIKHGFIHDKNSRVGDHSYPATEGSYEHVFNIAGGVIAAVNSHNPSTMTQPRPGTGDELVPLKQWSDVTFLSWQKYAGDGIKNLKYVFQSTIMNDDTNDVVRGILEKREEVMEAWPGLKIPMNEKDAQALLGTPNGRGVAWLLIQHKEQLGLKVPDAVSIFGTTYDLSTNLCFWIVDKEDMSFEWDEVFPDGPPQKRSINGTVPVPPVSNTSSISDRALNGVPDLSTPANITMAWPRRLERRLTKTIKTVWTSLWLV